MILLSPDDIKRMKEINKKLQGKRLMGGPVDDIGPLDITSDNPLYDYVEHNAEEISRIVVPLLKKERRR